MLRVNMTPDVSCGARWCHVAPSQVVDSYLGRADGGAPATPIHIRTAHPLLMAVSLFLGEEMEQILVAVLEDSKD